MTEETEADATAPADAAPELLVPARRPSRAATRTDAERPVDPKRGDGS